MSGLIRFIWKRTICWKNIRDILRNGKLMLEFVEKIKTDDNFAKQYKLGPIYGKQWRRWPAKR